MKLIQDVRPEPDWPEFGRKADGTEVRLTDVPALSESERAGVYYLSPKDERVHVYPWKDSGYYVDDDGNALAPCGPRSVSRVEVDPTPAHKATLRETMRAAGATPAEIDRAVADVGEQ